NYGTVTGNDFLETDDGVSGTLTINNHAAGLLTGGIDIQSLQTGLTVVVNNEGRIDGGSDHAFVMPTSGGSLILNNLASGYITTNDASIDVLKQGSHDTINNYGKIVVQPDSVDEDGRVLSSANAIDVGNGVGDVIHNYAGGLIEGSQHAVTGKRDITV